MLTVWASTVRPRLQQQFLIARQKLKWVDEVTGINEVAAYQDHVINFENQLIEVQQLRYSINQKLLKVRKNVRYLNESLRRIDKNENPKLYLKTAEDEIDAIREENDLAQKIVDLENKEHEFFSKMSFAIRATHEKERLCMQRTKYYSFIITTVSLLSGIYMWSAKEKNGKAQMKEVNSVSQKDLITLEQNIIEFVKQTISANSKSNVETPPIRNRSMYDYFGIIAVTSCVGSYILSLFFGK